MFEKPRRGNLLLRTVIRSPQKRSAEMEPLGGIFAYYRNAKIPPSGSISALL
ncbi:Uncharacterized protein dnm_081240 [Desulfonema magnum]|uniref:Uncharacterized protein n=1 Tax=Desulfonema magnum TaxID=45655 RepID=A0A975BVT6_9BACT|nr:Uncharacterized protein dnm_081240 [Desulfonema magnum]